MKSTPTYSMGAVARLTGLSAHVIRAWERRYGVIEPERTPGGTRRYSERDIARLRLLREATEAGHRIGDVADLSDAAIDRLLAGPGKPAREPETAILEAVDRLDLQAVEDILTMQFSVLGARGFAREVAAPLLREIGDRWERGETTIAAEHLVSTVTRGILGSALRGQARANGAPLLLFTTPEGERHEFGGLIAAVAALAAGGRVAYLGPELPVGEVAGAARKLDAAVVALSVVNLDEVKNSIYLEKLRDELPARVEIWAGGPGAVEVPGIERLSDLDELERRVARLMPPSPSSRVN